MMTISSYATYRDKWTLAEGVHPVLVPQKTEQFGVEARLEDLNF